MKAVLVAVPTVILHPLWTSSIVAHHLLDFVVQVKITEADASTICLDVPHPDYRWPSSIIPPFFMLNAFSAATFLIYPCLGQALDNAGFHTQWLGSMHTHTRMHTHTHTRTFNGPFSGTTRVGQYQKGKTNLDFTEARDSEWLWQQLGHMQVCTSLQTDNHASTSPLSFLQAGCPSCRPTNSIKALSMYTIVAK